MTKDNEKIRENRLRAAARRQGLVLAKSRRRDPRSYDYGTYMLMDGRTGAIVAAGVEGHAYGLSLDDVESVLQRGR